MALFDDEAHELLQTPPMALDALFCEEGLDDDDDHHHHSPPQHSAAAAVLDSDLSWDDDELTSLIGKEQLQIRDLSSLAAARREAVDWLLTVRAHFGFSALTAVLAVNYFDRFASGFQFQGDKPWMGRLAAVACLSLAAKVEETHVPLLLDLQVEESRFVFEAKTVQRMELLVLSTLKWRMHPVTPVSFFSHIVRRLGLKTHLRREFLLRCERLLLSTIPDARFASYLPSVLATATMLYVINEIEPFNLTVYQDQLLDVLKVDEDTVIECYNLVLETLSSGGHGAIQKQSSLKRKHVSEPESPNGVIDASFSPDNSNDSWAVEPRLKMRRAQDQQMRLAPINRVSVDVMTSPR